MDVIYDVRRTEEVHHARVQVRVQHILVSFLTLLVVHCPSFHVKLAWCCPSPFQGRLALIQERYFHGQRPSAPVYFFRQPLCAATICSQKYRYGTKKLKKTLPVVLLAHAKHQLDRTTLCAFQSRCGDPSSKTGQRRVGTLWKPLRGRVKKASTNVLSRIGKRKKKRAKWFVIKLKQPPKCI